MEQVFVRRCTLSELFASTQNLISVYDKAVVHVLTTFKVSDFFVKSGIISVRGRRQITFHLDNFSAAAAAVLMMLCYHRNSVHALLVYLR